MFFFIISTFSIFEQTTPTNFLCPKCEAQKICTLLKTTRGFAFKEPKFFLPERRIEWFIPSLKLIGFFMGQMSSTRNIQRDLLTLPTSKLYLVRGIKNKGCTWSHFFLHPPDTKFMVATKNKKKATRKKFVE